MRNKLSSPLRRRKLLSLGASLLVAILAWLTGVNHFGSSRAKDDWTAFDHQAFTVTKVVDGDTIHVRRSPLEPETIIRLIGIDAPELHDQSTGKPAHWSQNARRYVDDHAYGKGVTLRLEPIETRDRYDRLLAYVYLSDSDCLNLDLVRDGEAYADRRFRHSYRPQYEQAENDARKKQLGLWKNLTEDEMPPWRRNWLHAHEN